MPIKNNFPETVGVIMDGNRRFAKEKKILTADGHFAGYEKFKELCHWAKEVKIKNLAVFAFSSENWRRGKLEVNALLSLFSLALEEMFKKNNFDIGKIKFIGNLEKFPETLRNRMLKLEGISAKKKGVNIFVATSYGGREELVYAATSAPSGCGKNAKISEKEFSKFLYAPEISNLDMLIRTGGEKRLSNFLLWQSAYAELFFTDTLWPAFTKEEFFAMLSEYGNRQRRFGK